MATSDGISDADWGAVQQCAEDIVEADSIGVDSHLLKANLLNELGRLEDKYGRLPSILATEADYTADQGRELSLLKEAYVTACELNDLKNITYISASLAEFYIEERVDKDKLKYWLPVLTENAKKYSDEYIDSVIEDLESESN